MNTAIIAGGTGLIGSQLLKLLLSSNRYNKVISITRSRIEVEDPKLEQREIDFQKIHAVLDGVKADDVFCCLGTTIAKAGSKENFYQVDFYYPFLLAKTGFNLGATQYFLISALGANKDSSIYYNRVKGEIEEAISSVGFETFHIFRPSLLLGPRKEKRLGEEAAKTFYKYFGLLIPNKYKAIEASTVARSMLHFASLEQKGTYIHESKEMQKF
jgi:uncharacterized protein YbjT (DUF2867 family)